MTKIPAKVKKEILADPEYKVCMLRAYPGHVCGGRITLEHALIYGGKQVQSKLGIISVCAAGQEVDRYQDAHTMDKDLNHWVALNRASEEELVSISKAIDYRRRKAWLDAKYGVYNPKVGVPIPFLGEGVPLPF